MKQRGLHRLGQRHATALLCVLACPVASALAQPISDSSLALLTQWEELQVQHFKAHDSSPVDVIANETALVHYLAPPADSSCSDYSLTLSNLDEDKTAQFQDIGGLCRAAVTNTSSGVHLLQLSESKGRGERETIGQSSISLSAESKEVFIGLPTAEEPEQLALRQWPTTDANTVDISWWRRAFGWLPGIASVKSIQLRNSAARPQWQWLDQQCSNEQASPEGISALFHLHYDSATEYNADEYRVMTNCALSQSWPATASQFLAQWDEIAGTDSARDQAHLALAKLQYRVGDYQAVIDRVKPNEFESLDRIKAKHILAMAYIALEQHRNAISILKTGSHLATQPDTQSMEQANNPSLFMRYNLATALMLDGKTDEGLAVLDSLGQHPSNSPFSAALIERANLALGWQFIKRGNAGSAAPVFERVLLDGPFARRAALGLGWSWALAPGEKQKRVAEPVFQQHAGQSIAILRALYQNKKISCQEYREALQDEAVCSQNQYFNQAKQESEPQRSKNAIQVMAYLLENDLSDLVSIETSVQLSRMLKDQSYFEPANRVLSKAISAIKQQQHTLQDWQSGAHPNPNAAAAIPQEIRVWALSAEPTLLRDTLGEVAVAKQHYSLAHSPELASLEASLRGQLDSLVRDRTQAYLANLESYLAEAHHLRGRLLDQSQHVQSTADSSAELSAKLDIK